MVTSNGTEAAPFRRGDNPFGKGAAGLQVRKAGGSSGSVAKGLDTFWNGIDGAFLSPQLGGREEVSRPFEENPTLHACLVTKMKAIRQVTLGIKPSKDEDAEALEDHELLDLFTNPNPLQSGKMLFASTYALLKLDGEVYWFLLGKDGSPVTVGSTGIETPSSLWPVRKKLVRRNANGTLQYKTKGTKDGFSPEFSDDQVLRFYDFDPENMSGGLGDVEALWRQLTLQFQIERGTEGTVRNNGDPGGFISVEGTIGSTQKGRLQDKADDEFSDPKSRGKWKVLDKGAKYTPNPWSPKDMEWGEEQRRIEEKISGVLGVPLPLIGVWVNSTYNNLSEAKTDLWTGGNGVLSDLEYLVEFLNTFLFPRLADAKAAQFVAYFDTSSVKALQEDQTTRYTAAVAGVASGIGQTFNEAARAVGLEMEEPPANGDEPIRSAAYEAGPGGEGDGEGVDPLTEEELAGGPSLTVLTNAANIIGIATHIAAGTLARETGIGLLQGLFGMTSEEAALTLGPAGTGVTTEPDKPEPGEVPPALQGTDGDPNAKPGAKPDKDEEEAPPPKSFTKVASNADYYKAFAEAVLFPNDKALKAAAARFLRTYQAAQVKRLEAFARDGFEAKGYEAQRARMEGRKAVSNALSPDEIEALLLGRAEWTGKFQKLMSKPLFEAYVRALKNATTEIGGLALDVGDPRVIAALNEQMVQVTEGVTSNLAKEIRKSLVESMATASPVHGELQDVVRELLVEMKAGVTNAFPNIEARAETIARTESAKAANSARYEQFKASEVVQQHQWIDAGDSGTRVSHLRVGTMGPGSGGEIVDVGKSFSNGLRFPLDPTGPAAEVINCRCTVRPVISDPATLGPA